MIWALVNFQNSKFDRSRCEERLENPGFAGNAELNGLGIRVGMYLQWVAQLLADVFLHGEWANLFGTNMVFAFALTVAVFLLTLSRECTFTAEIIVIVFMFWGHFWSCLAATPGHILYYQWINSSVNTRWDDLRTGLYQTLGPYIPKQLSKMYAWALKPSQSLDQAIVVEIQTKAWARTFQNLVPILIVTAPALFMALYSLWFWIRLVKVGERDFLPNARGTYFFMLAKVAVNNRSAINFCVFVCVYLLLLFIIVVSAMAGRLLIETRLHLKPQSNIPYQLRGLLTTNSVATQAQQVPSMSKEYVTSDS